MTSFARKSAGDAGVLAASTSTPHEKKSGAAWLACAAPEEVDTFLGELSDNALAALPWLFEFWALAHQLPPAGDWKSWVIMGGRGAGNIVGYMASLPPDRRAELMQRSKGLREQSRALRQAARQAAKDRAAALLAEPFDKQRFIDAQTRQIEAEQRLRLAVRDVIAEAASNMTAAERRAFLNWRDRRGGPPPEADDAPPPKR